METTKQHLLPIRMLTEEVTTYLQARRHPVIAGSPSPELEAPPLCCRGVELPEQICLGQEKGRGLTSYWQLPPEEKRKGQAVHALFLLPTSPVRKSLSLPGWESARDRREPRQFMLVEPLLHGRKYQVWERRASFLLLTIEKHSVFLEDMLLPFTGIWVLREQTTQAFSGLLHKRHPARRTGEPNTPSAKARGQGIPGDHELEEGLPVKFCLVSRL